MSKQEPPTEYAECRCCHSRLQVAFEYEQPPGVYRPDGLEAVDAEKWATLLRIARDERDHWRERCYREAESYERGRKTVREEDTDRLRDAFLASRSWNDRFIQLLDALEDSRDAIKRAESDERERDVAESRLADVSDAVVTLLGALDTAYGTPAWVQLSPSTTEHPWNVLRALVGNRKPQTGVDV